MAEGIVALFYFVGCTLVVVALIYLVIKRINDKQNEDFEKRDN